ncbi:MFS transporter [Lichenicoccus sp.]|uniref:MFS transporter n=1 Tax=Lichenicoccus sp. TaxID=2781899 RepID=UPI003D0E96D1
MLERHQSADIEAYTKGRGIVIFLYLAYMLSFADRVIFGIVMKPAKAALGFTDSQLGLLAGAAFALSYAIFCPIGGLMVDKFNRKAIMVAAITFWSVMTFVTGLVSSFLAFAVVRACIGIGESLLGPLAVSLVGDSVRREERARVFGFYLSAGAVGTILAFVIGAGVIHLFSRSPHGGLFVYGIGVIAPWRAVFLAAALPGFVLAFAVFLRLREPPRTLGHPASAPAGHDDTMVFLKRHWTLLVSMFIGLAACQLGSFTWATWGVVFFGRVHGWSLSQSATVLGATTAISALFGCLACGRIIEAVRRRNVVSAPFWVGMISSIVFAILGSIGVMMPNASAAVAVLTMASFCGYMPAVSIFAAMGDLLPAAARGRFAGLQTLAIGVITNTLGPYMVGMLSDRAFPSVTGIRYSLLTTFLSTAAVGTLLVLPSMAAYRRRMQEKFVPAPVSTL